MNVDGSTWPCYLLQKQSTCVVDLFPILLRITLHNILTGFLNRPRGKGKHKSMDNTKLGNKKGKLVPKKMKRSPDERHK